MTLSFISGAFPVAFRLRAWRRATADLEMKVFRVIVLSYTGTLVFSREAMTFCWAATLSSTDLMCVDISIMMVMALSYLDCSAADASSTSFFLG